MFSFLCESWISKCSLDFLRNTDIFLAVPVQLLMESKFDIDIAIIWLD